MAADDVPEAIFPRQGSIGKPMDELEQQPLTEHLRDLRSCLINSLLAVAVGFSISYYFVQDIGFWFFKPLFEVLPERSSLIFTSYQEGFFFI
jgi:Sec-independent protein secretion pathway component TatC